MGYNPVDYSDIINKFTDYYGVSSQQAWDIVNTYNINPNQLSEILPAFDIYKSSDGVYRILNNAGNVSSYVEQVTIPTGSNGGLQAAINSNAQTGTAATATKVKFAGNSVIDQNGKIKTSPGVTKYSSGSSAGTTVMGVVGDVVSALAAASVGISLGKQIDSRLYNANPTFWNSLGLDTLNPQTWSSITSDLSDTGTEGALKSAFNFIFGIDASTGKTQAYMDADAYNYIAYALAQAGVFSQSVPTRDASEYTPIDSSDYKNKYADHLNLPVSVIKTTEIGMLDPTTSQYTKGKKFVADSPIYMAYVYPYRSNSRNNESTTVFASDSPFTVTYYEYNNNNWVASSTISSRSITINHRTYYYNYYGAYPSIYFNDGTIQAISADMAFIYGNNSVNAQINAAIGVAYLLFNNSSYTDNAGGKEGITDQNGATTPTGISPSSTQQQVADAIRQQYPNLYNNRIEQTVVQPDGTTITKIYYPVPMPNGKTDTTLEKSKNVTTDSEVSVILPQGQTITLPDGRTITGDGITAYKLPKGTYTLPTGTTITNNYITNVTDTTGGTQASTEADATSTDTLLQTLVNILTNLYPQSLTDTSTDSPTTTDTTSDTGDGNTPPIVIPTVQSAALFAVYNPTQAEINSFGQWLWSSNFIDQLLKMFNDPMQAIIGLHKTYIQPDTSTAQHIYVGYLDSGVSALTVPNQYTSMDCGSVLLEEYYGNVFDYSPYTKVYIYLPFIGFRELDVSQVMRSRIGVKYYGDAYTGACLAEISVTRDSGAGGVLYTFAGECSVRYPLSQGSYMGIVNAIAGLGVGAVSALAGIGGLGAVAGLSMMQHARTSVEHSGSFSGNAGAMGIKKPYLVVMRPQTLMASNYKHFSGAPSNSLITIKDANGLIRVRECHTENIPYATKEEKDMITRALQEGIIV